MENIDMNNETINHPNVFIVDKPMGSGKTCSAINYINNSNRNERFLIITPYISEVERYQRECPSKKFVEPYKKRGKKINGIKDLIRQGKNIVSTHALFQRFDKEIIDLCSVLNYTLIMDEVADVVRDTQYSEDDINNLLNVYCDYNEETGLLIWRDSKKDYHGKFDDAKNMSELGGLALARGKMLMWLFPIEVFKAFQKTFILTYMFNAQIQRYYYDYYNIQYKFIHVDGYSIENYHFTEEETPDFHYDYENLIHILNNEKLNKIGDEKFNLSVSWYEKNSHSAVMKQLKDNIYNFFNNIRKSKTTDNLWTCYKDYKNELLGKGYTKGYLFIGARAMNEYRFRSNVVYPVNIFLNPMIKGFFQDHGVEVDEDGYALSEMLQWIWRSAIRDGNPIWVYIPSSRMRNLLSDWIESVSITNNETSE